ncbi:UvrD-helicase domain-containing protein [Escherichia coli]
MGSCAAPSAKGDDKFITTDYLQQCHEFWIAGAGSGKTQKVIEDAIEVIKAGGRVLVVTYTMNNQAELRSRFVELYGALLNKSNFC